MLLSRSDRQSFGENGKVSCGLIVGLRLKEEYSSAWMIPG